MENSCKADKCGAQVKRKGFCLKHYKRQYIHGEIGLKASYFCKRCDSEISYRNFFASALCGTCFDKNYYAENKQRWIERKNNNLEQHKIYSKAYYLKNRDKILSQDKSRASIPVNKAKKNARYQAYRKQRESYDINYKLRRILRNRLNIALRNNQKVGSAVSDLGCSIEEFKLYLESKFQPGMTWDNHGEWHIDHVVPLVAFNLENVLEFNKACHYTNLQPLWKQDHFIKTSRDVKWKS